MDEGKRGASTASGSSELNLPQQQQHTLRGHQGTVTNIRFNRLGTYCLSCGQDKTLRLWNPHKGIHIKTYQGHGYEVLDVAVSNDNNQLASCGGDRQIFLWDVASGQIVRRFRGHEARVNCVAWNEDCSVLVSGSYDKMVHLWDCRSRSYTPIQTLNEAKDSVSALFITDHEIFTGSIDGCVRNYDIRAGRLRTDHLGNPVTSVALSNDKNCILASCLDATIRLIDKENGELLSEYKGHKNTEYKITSTFSNTDAYVVSGSEDSVIYIWDLVDTKVVRKLRGHTKVVCGLAYHPVADTHVLLSCSQDATIKVWTKELN
jgi:mitogen-activated protein kinase organizer 1